MTGRTAIFGTLLGVSVIIFAYERQRRRKRHCPCGHGIREHQFRQDCGCERYQPLVTS